MDDYSDDVFNEIQNDVQIWCDAFAKTDSFRNLNEAVQENAWFITSAFSEQMYNYHLQTPDEWTVYALEEVICDIFPHKITAAGELFNSVEPVLRAFFQYLNDNGLIKNSNELIKALRKAIPIMLKYSNDSANWGPAKQFAMAAMQSGVDLEDKLAMNKFMAAYNVGSVGGKPIPVVSAPKTGRNDPCPCGSGRKYKHCCGKNV